MIDHRLGDVRPGFGAPILSDEPEEIVFAVVTDPHADSPEDRYMTSSSAMLAGKAVQSYFDGERGIDEVLVPDPLHPNAFEVGPGTDLLLEMDDDPGRFRIFRGPVHVEEHLLAVE